MNRRDCNGCTACCTAIGVGEIGKPFNTACKHLCDKGCGIYRRHPKSCKEYSCMWLLGVFEYNHRPDRFGVVFHPSDEGFIDAFIIQQDIDAEKLRLACVELLRIFPMIPGIRFVRWDQQLNTAFPVNLRDYPGCENIGEGTTWLNYSNKMFILDAPTRKLSLTVLDG